MSMDGKGETAADADPVRAYAGPVAHRRIKRIKLALFLSAMAACLSVSLIGGIAYAILNLFGNATGFGMFDPSRASLMGGVSAGFQMAAFNFIVFFFTVPAAWIALGLSIGRLPHRGISARRAYIRWGAIWGAVLVGGTTFGFGLFGGPMMAAGALVSGAAVGALAGAGCGLLFLAIVRPEAQLRDVDVSMF
ncbi:putative lipoprotein [Hyphomonas johnsonii MHS-2]|uniref:Putative lipoprotein n=2 Tax=Hyphomonas johnsonii TaxID=81031 RepID=A0A059FCL7_9PROT|nr:putative lipoprotein [Hyphomonas johnsonii MHS-2]